MAPEVDGHLAASEVVGNQTGGPLVGFEEDGLAAAVNTVGCGVLGAVFQGGELLSGDGKIDSPGLGTGSLAYF